MITAVNVAQLKAMAKNVKKAIKTETPLFYVTCLEISLGKILNTVKGETKLPDFPEYDIEAENIVLYTENLCEEVKRLYIAYRNFEKAGVASSYLLNEAMGSNISAHYLTAAIAIYGSGMGEVDSTVTEEVASAPNEVGAAQKTKKLKK